MQNMKKRPSKVPKSALLNKSPVEKMQQIIDKTKLMTTPSDNI